jgi:hypothetical protein
MARTLQRRQTAYTLAEHALDANEHAATPCPDFAGSGTDTNLWLIQVECSAPLDNRGALDHDDFGLNQSKIIKRDRFNELERDAAIKFTQISLRSA